MGFVVFHPADGADDASPTTGGIDADEIHDLARMKITMRTLRVVQVHFLDGCLELHQI